MTNEYSPVNWTINRASKNDCEHLALIGAATFLETFAGILDGNAIVAHCHREHSSTAYAHQFANDAQAWLARLKPGGAPIGFALMGRVDLPGMSEGDVELKRIYALSRFHGTGLGAALMKQAVGAALSDGANRLLLGVYAENHRAIGFYRKEGFDPIANRKFNVGGTDYDDVVLAKKL